MTVLPRIVSPIRRLFERQGVEIALITVEVWPEQVIVRLAGLPNALTDELQSRFESEVEEWVGRRNAVGRADAGDFPAAPGELLLAALDVSVRDEAGTAYVLRSSSAGGSDTEWRGDWSFAGDAPRPAKRLTVIVASPEGEQATVDIELGS